MSQTTREQLEAALSDLNAFVSECDQKHRLSDDDTRQLNQKSAKVSALVAQVKAANLNTPAPPSGFDYSDLGSVANAKAPRRTETFGAPSLDITEKTIEDLHTAALGRHVLVKAAVDSAEAPMSLAGDYRTNSVFPWLRDKPRLLNFIPTERTDAPTVHYYRATAGATAAAAVAEGANKPESSPVWEQVSATVRKLAHYTRVNDEVLADFNNFRDVIGQEMLAGLIDEENDQLLNGTGIAPNILGLSQTVGIQTVGSAGTDLDSTLR